MAKPPLSHFSPVFANQPWANNEGYISYYRDQYRRKVQRAAKGKRQWGRRRGLYSWKVEIALNRDLETEAAHTYSELLKFTELNADQRLTWAQFLISQVVRTPTFLRYEMAARRLLGITDAPARDRVGCKECGDLVCLTSRNWCFLLAHRDDYFVRGDNPVLITGFIERPETCLFYPLSPQVCFIACSMSPDWKPTTHALGLQPASFGLELEKGGAHFINFHLARAAEESLILSPTHDGQVASAMFTDVLGLYPQPPFLLHSPSREEMATAFESIRSLMGAVDGLSYPSWLPFELEPFPRKRPESAGAALPFAASDAGARAPLGTHS
jgi:hypothetical protein